MEERGWPLQVGRWQFNSKGNLPMGRQDEWVPTPAHHILKVYKERGPRWGQTWISHRCSQCHINSRLHPWSSLWERERPTAFPHPKDRAGGEEPLVAWVRHSCLFDDLSNTCTQALWVGDRAAMDLASVPKELFCPQPHVGAGEAVVNRVGTAPSQGELKAGTHHVHGASTAGHWVPRPRAAETSLHVGVPSLHRFCSWLEVGGLCSHC